MGGDRDGMSLCEYLRAMGRTAQRAAAGGPRLPFHRAAMATPTALAFAFLPAATVAGANTAARNVFANDPGSAASSLSQILWRRVGFPEHVVGAAGSIAPSEGYARCRRRATRVFTCRFRYMPGNTVYAGSGTIRQTPDGPVGLTVRYDLHLTALRLSPPIHLHWRGAAVTDFGSAP